MSMVSLLSECLQVYLLFNSPTYGLFLLISISYIFLKRPWILVNNIDIKKVSLQPIILLYKKKQKKYFMYKKE